MSYHQNISSSHHNYLATAKLVYVIITSITNHGNKESRGSKEASQENSGGVIVEGGDPSLEILFNWYCVNKEIQKRMNVLNALL